MTVLILVHYDCDSNGTDCVEGGDSIFNDGESGDADNSGNVSKVFKLRPNFNRLLLTSNCPGLSPAEFQSTLQLGAGSLFRPPTLSRAPTPTAVTRFDASNATAPLLVASAAATRQW